MSATLVVPVKRARDPYIFIKDSEVLDPKHHNFGVVRHVKDADFESFSYNDRVLQALIECNFIEKLYNHFVF